MLIAAVLVAGHVPVFAAGFHNAALSSRSLDEWLSNVKPSVPDLKVGSGNAEMKLGDHNSLRDAAHSVAEGVRQALMRSGSPAGNRKEYSR